MYYVYKKCYESTESYSEIGLESVLHIQQAKIENHRTRVEAVRDK